MSDGEYVWSGLNLIAAQALERFGKHTRILKLIEEMGELQSELAKSLIGHKRASDERVIDEIADVFITLESVAIAFGFERVEAAIPNKLDRLAAAIADSLPPVSPPAAEPPSPTEELSQTDAAEGREVVCSKSTLSVHTDAFRRALKLSIELRHALGVLENGDDTADACGLELLRIANALHTESKRLRAGAFGARIVEALDDEPDAEEIADVVRDVDVPALAAKLRATALSTPSGGAELSLPAGWIAHAKQWGRR